MSQGDMGSVEEVAEADAAIQVRKPDNPLRGEPRSRWSWLTSSGFLGLTGALGGVVLGAVLTDNSHHNAAVRDDQVEAFSTYSYNLSRLTELMWANAWWAGTDREGVSDGERTRLYWEPATELAATLDANWAAARIVTSDPEIVKTLTEMRELVPAIMREFRCRSHVGDGPADGCEDLGPASNAEIREGLESRFESLGLLRTQLLERASSSLS